MSDTESPRYVAPSTNNTTIINPPRRSHSTLRFPLHRPHTRNPRPSLEQLEGNRQVARQAERDRRDNSTNRNSINVDDISSNNDSDEDSLDLFSHPVRRFRRPDYVSPPPSSTRPVSELVDIANTEILEGKIDIGGNFLCPLLQTIPLDPVNMNGTVFEKSAIDRYIRMALTDEIDSDNQPRVVRDMMTRKVLYTKQGDNSAMEKAAVDTVIS